LVIYKNFGTKIEVGKSLHKQLLVGIHSKCWRGAEEKHLLYRNRTPVVLPQAVTSKTEM